MSFAERMGFTSPRSLPQTGALDAETRIELWNIVYLSRGLTQHKDMGYDVDTAITAAIWAWYFKNARDEQPGDHEVWGRVKTIITDGEWFEALDCIEAYGKYLHRFSNQYTYEVPDAFDGLLNATLEQYLVGYRLVGRELVPLGDDVSAAAVTDALDLTAKLAGARNHLIRATELLADRQTPDYPNAIKEAISAVESVVATVTGQGTLGAGLKKLKAAGIELHPALESAWSKMYGWTSDAQGIRHAAIDETDADQSLAKYMLVACSAFVSYVIESGSKSSLV
ncbi:AbiJ-NTD4 domain-containing protein [Curtobacterium flaccumfaciens]|uniref:AbiJ-NTD4 domain-containing protein n=1 Tax=Curtobacterium flaccumfaciens TaxID=2035 RepID=UPI001BDE508E|nr:hypothetical protein [Curtobacterium flaccumfaciens]MBT1671827.1 hypothetical protein [Curtobacterium flaccumfaciens pv. flaccumfaciens]